MYIIVLFFLTCFYLFINTIQAHERTSEETEKLKTLKQKHDEITKQVEERVESSKALENAITESGKE